MAMPVGTSARPPPAGEVGVLAGVEVEAGVAGVGVGGERQVGIEPDDRHGQRHRPDPTDHPIRVFRCIRGLRAGGPRTKHSRCAEHSDGIGSGVPSGAMERPPSVDALARSLAGSGLPHAAARRRRPGGDRRRRRRRRAGAGRRVAAHAADAGRQRHRRPAAHQPRPGAARPPPVGAGAVARARPARPASAGSRQRAVGSLLARLCGAEAAIVVNNNAAAVLLVLAALAAGRDVPVSRGESVEIGGGFRVPEVMAQSGARLVDVGTTNRTRLADYRRAVDAERRRPRAQGAPEQLPRRRLRRGHVGGRAGHARAARRRRPRQRPGRRRPARGGRGRTRRRGSPASRPPCRRSPPAPRWSRSAATSCSAARRPGSSPGGPTSSAAARAHPLARAAAARRPRARRAAGRSCSPTCAATSWRRCRSGGWPPRPSPTSTARAEAIAAATGATAIATDALPGAGSAPGTTIPSAGVRLDGDHLATLRAHDPPVIARARDGVTVARPARRRAGRRRRGARGGPAAGAGDRHRRPRRPRQVVARPRADRHRPRPLRRGEAPRA